MFLRDWCYAAVMVVGSFTSSEQVADLRLEGFVGLKNFPSAACC